MPRKKREWYKGACYHIMGRGNRHAAIYKDEDDYAIFLMLLRDVMTRYPYTLHALCLMTNHFHLQLTTKDTPIWKIMQPVMNHYARTFNEKHGFDGHLFESRYTSCLIENDIYFLEVSRYIHLNPVKAQMVREPLAYDYSSYGLFVTHEGAFQEQKKTISTELIEELTDTTRVLSCFRNNPHEQYRLFVEGKISHAEQELLIQKDMKEDEMWLPW